MLTESDNEVSVNLYYRIVSKHHEVLCSRVFQYCNQNNQDYIVTGIGCYRETHGLCCVQPKACLLYTSRCV